MILLILLNCFCSNMTSFNQLSSHSKISFILANILWIILILYITVLYRLPGFYLFTFINLIILLISVLLYIFHPIVGMDLIFWNIFNILLGYIYIVFYKKQ